MHTPHRRYVLRVIPSSQTVVVGDEVDTQTTRFEVAQLQRFARWGQTGAATCEVQVRHRAKPARAQVRWDGAFARVELQAPVRAVSPGQAAVFYEGDRVLGGGWIAPAPPHETRAK